MASARLVLAAALAAVFAASAARAAPQRARDAWDFRFKRFVIGAWWGPGATDAEMQLYREAGFNVVMTGRYMQLDDYGHADRGLRELDLARKHGLAVMFDTYTRNEHPWGGRAGPTDAHPTHHPASLAELQWLYGKLGRHPAMAGFMIGDDQGAVSDRAAECTRFLHEQGPPHLMPWLCGWIAPDNLAAHGNPIEDPQIYPTLYQWQLPASELVRQYCLSYAGLSRKCRDLGVIFWPMFNTTLETRDKPEKDMFGALPSDSLVRFPAYAALAYGAEGIWYFTYNGGAVQHLGEHPTLAEAREALTPLYPVVQRVNRRVAPWGPLLLGRASTGLFGTAFGARAPAAAQTDPSREGTALVAPAPGKLIEGMDGDLLVGILTKAGRPPLAMVVDCRASKGFGDLPERVVSLRFAPAVRSVRILDGRRSRGVRGGDVSVTLEAGGGELLELAGDGLEALCRTAAIYGAPQ